MSYPLSEDFRAGAMPSVLASLPRRISPLPLNRTESSLLLEKLDDADAQGFCDPQDRVERRIGDSSLHFADKRLIGLGFFRQLCLGHVQGKSQLLDVAAQISLHDIVRAFWHYKDSDSVTAPSEILDAFPRKP